MLAHLFCSLSYNVMFTTRFKITFALSPALLERFGSEGGAAEGRGPFDRRHDYWDIVDRVQSSREQAAPPGSLATASCKCSPKTHA